MNIFNEQNEFIDTDPRNERPTKLAYSIDAESMYLRHRALLPPEVLRGKTVLDLGSCNASTGAWCLSNGAKNYTGVEFQEQYIVQSRKNLDKYYPDEKWSIVQDNIQNYLQNNNSTFDIVVALGVVHAFDDIIAFLYKISSISQCIVLDGSHPTTLSLSPFLSSEFRSQIVSSKEYFDFIEKEPFIGLQRTGMSLHSKKTVVYRGLVPSMGAIIVILDARGFKMTAGVNESLKTDLPDIYSPQNRYGLRLVKVRDGGKSIGFPDRADGALRIINWE